MINYQISDSNKHKQLGDYLVVVAAFAITATFGIRFAFGVFLKPMISDLGWTRAITSGAYSLTGIIQGFAGLVIGRMTDRFGPRIVLTIIGLFMGIGHILMSQVSEVWQLYLFLGVIIGIGSSIHIPVLSTIARRFKARRGLMTGIVMSGVGVGQLIVPPVAALLINTYDWRIAYIVLGIAALIIMTSASQFMKTSQPKDTDILTAKEDLQSSTFKSNKVSVRDVLHTKQIWIILAIQFCSTYCTQGILVHIVPHTTDLGIAPTVAASIISVSGGTLLISRIIVGNAADRIGERMVFLMGLSLLVIALISLFFIGKAWEFYLFAVCIGFAISTRIVDSPLIARIYGLKAHATIFSMINFAITIGVASGPYLFGYLHDIANSYNLAFIVAIIIAGLGLISAIVLVLDKPKYNEIL